MDTLLTMIILLAISLGAIALAVSIAKPAATNAADAAALGEAGGALARLDAAIREAASEGEGAQRVVRIFMPVGGRIDEREDSIVAGSMSSPLQDYLSRRAVRDTVSVGGNDVSCSAGDNLTQENSFIKVVYQSVPRANPLPAISTARSILMVEEKTGGTRVYPSNTSIVIDGNASASNGTGYSEVLRTGTGLPFCIVHLYVNSTAEYDVYYTLYAGADFVVADIRNVR